MFIPLVDSLRCPRPHDATWLVASIDRAENRDILEGVLGCPACLAEYPIRDGIVYFDANVERSPFLPPDEMQATRLAAALELVDPRMVAVLHGDWGAHAPLIRAISPAHLLLVNPPDGVMSGDGVSIVLSDAAPIAQTSMDGAAVDVTASEAMSATLRASLKGGRRMLGPATMPVPAFLTELTRDTGVWVAQLDAGSVTSAPVLPTRRPRTESQ